MLEIIKEIRANLQGSKYQNEEHVRFSLVGHILLGLGWNIWNPDEVFTEDYPNPQENKKRVDITLYLDEPMVHIEIKRVGGFTNIKDFENAQTQLRDYNNNLTATFAIITDGRMWHFYHSRESGEFSRKEFCKIDLLNSDTQTIIDSFSMFLSKDAVKSGSALEKAKEYLSLGKKHRAMEDSWNAAQNMAVAPPYPSLVDALFQVLQEKNSNISREEIVEYAAKRPKHNYSPQEPGAILYKIKEMSEGYLDPAGGSNCLDVGEKGKKVTFEELGFREGQKLIFCSRDNRKTFPTEWATVVLPNSLRYKGDGRPESKTGLAQKLLVKVGINRKIMSTQGTLHWVTEDGKLLISLEREMRDKRGY